MFGRFQRIETMLWWMFGAVILTCSAVSGWFWLGATQSEELQVAQSCARLMGASTAVPMALCDAISLCQACHQAGGWSNPHEFSSSVQRQR